MIKKLRVKNFLSLKDVEIRPGRNNVLVGPNASGKSNIIRVLNFLTDVAHNGLTKSFTDRLGYAEVAWKGKDSGPIKIGVQVDWMYSSPRLNLMDQGSGTIRQAEYEIEIDGTSLGLITVLRERLTLAVDGKEVDLIDLRVGRGACRRADGSKAFEEPGNPAQSALEYNVPGWEGTLFRQYLAGWQFHRLFPEAMKQVNPATRTLFLSERGENLAAWLATLKTSYSENFRQIEQVAKDAFPGLQEIVTELTQSQTIFLSSRDKNLVRPVSVWGLADGQLCFIALASLILAPAELGAPLHCAEEIENHLNPHLLATFVELLKQAQTTYEPNGAQVFITTHSPHLVDQFDLDEIIVVEKTEGRTYCIRPSDKPRLRELLERKELGLGDLWYSGALGGS